MPSRNPFRHPAPSRKPSPPLPESTSGPTTQQDHTPEPLIPPVDEVDEDDLPPPYTPAANSGEETIGVGPQRPFQPAASLPPAPPASSSSSSLPFHPPPPPRPHQWHPPAHPPPPRPYPPGPPPPGPYFVPPAPFPQGLAPWQSPQPYNPDPPRQQGGLLDALFDTIRDIADTVTGGGGGHDEQTVVVQRGNSAAYAPPYSSPYLSPYSGSPYAPPPGPPPHHRPPPPRPRSTPPRPPPAQIPDDGSPTHTPVPGHPLLRGGHLLVYPKDYACVKCKNTGYKNHDPSNPCRKCWDKYGKPYTGALSYMTWSATGNDPRMQRPLPRFVPPHLADMPGPQPQPPSCSHRGRFPPPPQHPLHHSRSVSQPLNHPGSEASYYVMNPFAPDAEPPVPGAIPLNPGDPRLGGRQCMRCDGSGYQTVMSIDVVMCDDCGGTGRVWR